MNPDKSEKGSAVPTVQKGSMVEDLRAQAQILALSIPGLNDLEHLSAVSQPQFPHLKAGYNDTYFSGVLQGLVEGLLVKL